LSNRSIAALAHSAERSDGPQRFVALDRRRVSQDRPEKKFRVSERSELRNFPVDPRNAGDPASGRAPISGKSPFGFFWDDCQKKLARQAQRERNAFDFKPSDARRIKQNPWKHRPARSA